MYYIKDKFHGLDCILSEIVHISLLVDNICLLKESEKYIPSNIKYLKTLLNKYIKD